MRAQAHKNATKVKSWVRGWFITVSRLVVKKMRCNSTEEHPSRSDLINKVI